MAHGVNPERSPHGVFLRSSHGVRGFTVVPCVCPTGQSVSLTIAGFSGTDAFGTDWSVYNMDWVTNPFAGASCVSVIAYQSPTWPAVGSYSKSVAPMFVVATLTWLFELEMITSTAGGMRYAHCYYTSVDSGSCTPVGLSYTHSGPFNMGSVSYGTVTPTAMA